MHISDSRRGFMQKLLIGSSTAVVLSQVKMPTEVVEQTLPEKPESQGYRETEHVRAYYRAAGL